LLGRLSSHTYNYSILSGQRFGVIRAQGFLFKDVLEQLGTALHPTLIKPEEVYQFRFGTSDGYDHPMTYDHLFNMGNRYYFPNYDIGSRQEAQVVPPMLAYTSCLAWNQSEASSQMTMDEGTRFRLVFGPLWSGESNSSYQIYYIHTITVVLKGAPPAGSGDGNGSGNGNGSGDGNGSGIGSGNGSGSGNGQGTGVVDGGANGTSVGTGASLDGANSADPLNAASSGSVAGLTQIGDANEALTDPGGQGGSAGWRVYEIIGRSQSQVEMLELEIPFAGVAFPVVLGGIALGVGSTYVNYRRRLIPVA
jgi:hypothetical protein